jgi:hypothetical protein
MRDSAIKHAIVVALSICLASAASPPVNATPEARSRGRLQRVGTVTGALEDGATGTHFLSLTRGREHRVVAACEGACGDMTMRLLSPAGVELVWNTAPAALPELAAVPSGTGRHRVDVTMARCAAARCGYSLIVFAR